MTTKESREEVPVVGDPDTPAAGLAGFAEPQTVAIAGDWHGNIDWATYVLRRNPLVPDFDAVVHVGDFGLWPGPRGVRYLDQLEDFLAARDTPLYWVDGNHEDHDAIAACELDGGVRRIRPHIIHLPRGFRWTWHGQTWLAFGGAASIDREHRVEGRSWWPGEAITDADVAAAVAGGHADILICHDAPTGVGELDRWLTENGIALRPDVQAYADHSRHQVRRVVDGTTPTHLFHGHYHLRYDDTLTTAGHDIVITGLDCDRSTMARNLIRRPLPIGS